MIGKLPPPTLAIALLKLRLCVVTRAAAAQLAAAQSACTTAAAVAGDALDNQVDDRQFSE